MKLNYKKPREIVLKPKELLPNRLVWASHYLAFSGVQDKLGTNMVQEVFEALRLRRGKNKAQKLDWFTLDIGKMKTRIESSLISSLNSITLQKYV